MHVPSSLFYIAFGEFRFPVLGLGLVMETLPSSELAEEEELLWQGAVASCRMDQTNAGWLTVSSGDQ
jgi:hypothetical protein